MANYTEIDRAADRQAAGAALHSWSNSVGHIDGDGVTGADKIALREFTNAADRLAQPA